MERFYYLKNAYQYAVNENMNDLGILRFLISGAFLLFGIYMAIMGLYVIVLPILIAILWITGYCSQWIIDREQMLMKRYVGFYTPFIKVRNLKINGVQKIELLSVVSSKTRRGTNSPQIHHKYKLYVSLTNSRELIKTSFEKKELNALGKDLSEFLNVAFYKT